MQVKRGGRGESSRLLLKSIVFLMFAMFAMTTDSVGTVIPEIIREFELGLTAGGAFHYATMSGIGVAAILLGFMADRFGRRYTILIGLVLFGVPSALFALGHDFAFFVALLFVSGLGIGIFKAGALALIGDISHSTREHSATMNLVEGFFGVGAILGPAIVVYLLQVGAGWKWIYLIAAALCVVLITATTLAPFPAPARARDDSQTASTAFRMLKDPVALFFALALMLYVGAEAAIYVWAPTYLAGYEGDNAWLAAYAVSIFFILRAAGRFFGAWLLGRFKWAVVLTACSAAMMLLFWMAVAGGREVAIYALPATGIFMSVLYPTINSKGISCYEKHQHGSIAGFLLFFTCVGAVMTPLFMAAISDSFGDTAYSLVLASLFATLLAGLCAWNLVRAPFAARLAQRDEADYEVQAVADPAG